MSCLRKLPGPLPLPIIGNLYFYKLGIFKVTEYHKVLMNLHKKYGPIVKSQLGPRSATIIHLFDPDDVETVHSNEGKMPFVKPLQSTVQHYRKINNESPGLGNINGEEWYRLRSSVRQLLLRPVEVQTFLPQVNNLTDELIVRLRAKSTVNGEIQNLRNELAKWSREVAGWICFGRHLGSMDGDKGEAEAESVIEASKIVFRINAKLKFSLPFYRYFDVPSWKEFIKYENIISHNGATLVKEAVEKMGKDHNHNCRVLEYLLSRPELDDKDISTIILSLITDSLSTTVPTLMCNLHCLAANPSIQDEAYEEVKAAAEDGNITTKSLANIPLVKAITKEVFRMYPNGVEVDRILQEDHVLSGYDIPAGTNVTLNQFVHFRSDKYFENPDEFWPHRWLRTQSESTIHKYLLLPFGFGARSCVGRRFAEQDLYVSIAKILLNFKLTIDHKEPLDIVFETLLYPREPLKIQFKPR